MKRHIKKILILVTLTCLAGVTFADRGAGKKSKVKTVLNINTGNNLKNSILTNIRYGLTYKGSLLAPAKQTNTNTAAVTSSLMTYQKGNTTYIIPYKNKITLAEVKQGYAGIKLIIRSNR